MNLYEMFEDQKELTFMDALAAFLPIAMEHLGLEKLPTIHLRKDLKTQHLPSFGQFSNDDNVINVDIENRHPNDVLRTLAHELTHYWQNTQNMLGAQSWRTGSPDEDQANAEAGVIMRKFNKTHPEFMRLKPIVISQQIDEKRRRKNKSKPSGYTGYYGYYWGGSNDSGDAGGGDGGGAESLQEGLGKGVVLVAALASLLAANPAVSEPSAAAQAIGIARQINRMKNYGPEAAQAEAYQELKNLIRALGNQGNNHSKLYPLVKDMIQSPEQLPTEVEQLPPLTSEPVNEKWSQKYKRSINCNNPKGFSQRAHCQGRKKSNEAVEPDEPGYQHDVLTMPQNTLVIDTPGELDWYKIGQHFPNLGKEDPHEYGQSESDMVMSFATPEEMAKFIQVANRLGLKVKSIGGSQEHPEIHAEPKMENFADGKKPGRKGLAKRMGVNCKQPVSKLRSIAKNSSGERARMAHWCANMKSGRNK